MATTAVAGGAEVQVGGVCGTQHRLNGVDARVGNRAGRQARVEVGVVGRVDSVIVGLGEVQVPPLPGVGLVAHRVLHGGVGLKPHALLQPVQVHVGDHRALVCHAGFALDDGGDGHDLI